MLIFVVLHKWQCFNLNVYYLDGPIECYYLQEMRSYIQAMKARTENTDRTSSLVACIYICDWIYGNCFKLHIGNQF